MNLTSYNEMSATSDNTTTISNITTDTPDKKYPIAKSGKQCLSPCYEPGTYAIHPVTLQYVIDKDNPFCAIHPYEKWDPVRGQMEIYTHDECYVPTAKEDIVKKQIEMDILLPIIDFSCSRFLNLYYDSNSFEDIFIWFDKNPDASNATKMRLIECGWKVYGNDVNVVSDSMVNFYVELIKKSWIKYLYPTIKSYIQIDGDNIYVEKKKEVDNTTRNDKHKIMKVNYFIKNFVTKNNVYKFLTTYIEHYSSQWNEIESHNENIRDFFIKYIIEKMN